MGQVTYKNGKQEGLSTGWYENGWKKWGSNWKAGERNGRTIRWYENGQKSLEENYKDGKLVSAVAWKRNGQKCPVTKIDEDGNGLYVWYNEDGTESFRIFFKNGQRVN
jgi:antitoxin component YwqK of YwqJK toxin-antitoxin module